MARSRSGARACAQGFHASIDATDARIIGLQCPDDDLVLLLVLDLSSGDLTVVDPAKETLLEEIRKTAGEIFRRPAARRDDGLHVLEDPTANRETIAGEIALPTLGRKTGLLSTIDDIERVGDAMLANPRACRRSLRHRRRRSQLPGRLQ